MEAETKYFSHTLTLSAQSTPPKASFPAKLAYRTFGSPSSPAILIPTCYGGTLSTELTFLYQRASPSDPTPPFDPSTHFIIIVGLLGGTESSSPSNTPAPFDGPRFPRTTYQDNINLQHALCLHLGIKQLRAYCGFSMGGQQAYHFAVLYPEFVENVISICSSARTSWHNWCFLEGPKAALVNSCDFKGGDYEVPALRGTGAFGRVYSAWALSPEWFRRRCWEELGFASLEAYLKEEWEEGGIGKWDANDLLALLATWQMGDVTVYDAEGEVESKKGGKPGDLEKALGKVKARVLIMPCRTDAYFPVEDSERELHILGWNAELKVIESCWGHVAGGGGGTKEDSRAVADEVTRFMKSA